MCQPLFHAAIFAIIRDSEGRILFQKRQNTGFMDGFFQLPSGHMELWETMKESFTRELQEELSIEVEENDINIIHISQRIAPDKTYFNIYAFIRTYTWEIRNAEPEKYSDLQYLYPSENTGMVGFNREVLDFIEANMYFSQQFDKW